MIVRVSKESLIDCFAKKEKEKMESSRVYSTLQAEAMSTRYGCVLAIRALCFGNGHRVAEANQKCSEWSGLKQKSISRTESVF